MGSSPFDHDEEPPETTDQDVRQNVAGLDGRSPPVRRLLASSARKRSRSILLEVLKTGGILALILAALNVMGCSI